MEGKLGDLDYNLAQARDMATEAFVLGAKIVALPEFFSSPVFLADDTPDLTISDKNNSALHLLKTLATENSGYIGGSALIRTGSSVYNRYYFVEPDGTVHFHDKDLPTMWENCFYEGGSDEGVMSTALGGVGAAVCWELIRSQTLSRLKGKIGLAMTGTHWWNIPNNWPLVSVALAGISKINQRLSSESPSRLAKAIGAPVIHASHCGQFSGKCLCVPGSTVAVNYQSEFVGATQVVNAFGEVIAKRECSEGPGIVMAEIALGSVAPTLNFRPEDFWFADLTLLHKLFWWHQNACGKSYYQRQLRKDIR
ncbi:hypothetical protein A8L45_19955 [Veronia pacifica]|uniref:CN hydrolase domain-containing protein n=2 Tax=Veronia pacifica TaxID=1080227 RepID=A0A1C3EBL6_9GAMM|nr:hypothetical protein A8L45_19955 [Veronia pacifica]